MSVVCIVDDDASLRRSLRNLLTSEGFCVRVFDSAEAFLEEVEVDVGCAVIDVRMAGMSGVELLRHLTATGSGIPVVVLSAHGDDATRRQSLEAGAVAFLEKPAPAPALLDAIRRAVAR